MMAQKCSGISDYPTDLWSNTRLKDEEFVDKVCCVVDGEEGMDRASVTEGECAGGVVIQVGKQVGIVVGAVVGVLALAVLCCFVGNAQKNKESIGREVALQIVQIQVSRGEGRRGRRMMC